MKRIITVFTLLMAICICDISQAQIWKSRRQKEAATSAKPKEKVNRYDKLFKDKRVETATGLMKIHKVGENIYVEFPLSMLGRDLLLTSSIESTSDAGEGYAGQFGGRAFRMHFTLEDSTLQARTSILSVPLNSSDDSQIESALNHSTVPAIYKGFKVLAYTPDSSAVVVDMKKLFFESSTFTKPFPSNAANSYYGFVSRNHKFKSDLSRVLGVKASAHNIVVRGEMSYRVDHTLMGAYSMYEDVPLTAIVNKMLVELPDQPMRPRVSDSRVGVSSVLKSDFHNASAGVKAVRFARRWDIRPIDSVKYKNGELCDVVKPVVFYMDTMLPQSWKQYIREGVLEWNKAFENIGFKNVVKVEDFPADSLFDANDFAFSTIRYSPAWTNSAQVTLQHDARTGEILNASIGIGGNMVSIAQSERTVATMASDPRVRKEDLPVELMGEMVRANIMQAVGESLGLTRNMGASSAYPVDSLKSVSFTSKYGIYCSAMDEVLCNRVADENDVKRGVALVNKSIGEYDYFAIKWLYKPIFEKSYKEEAPVLEGWIAEQNRKPFGKYIASQSGFPADPRTVSCGLGNDNIKTMKYMMVNLKKSYDNYFVWFADGDKDLRTRSRMNSYLYDDFVTGFNGVLSYIGGIYIDDVREGEGESFRPVDKAKQKEALNYAVELMRDLKWLDNSRYATQFEIGDDRVEKCRFDMFMSLFSRLSYVEISAERSKNPYTANEYLDDMYKIVWNKTIQGKRLDYVEQQLQTAFLNTILKVSTVTGKVGSFKAASERGFALRDQERESADIYPSLLTLESVKSGKIDAVSVERISGFSSVGTPKTETANVSAHYYSLLIRMRDMLRNAEQRALGDDKKHYTMLVYKINKALDIN